MTFLRLACALALGAAGSAQSPSVHATRVVAFDDMAQAGGGVFNPPDLLGRPDGRVSSLGIGGWVVLGFDVVITDGPGVDLIVSEDAVFSGPLAHSTAETMFVEVSTDGVTFVRIPNAYYGPPVDPGAGGVISVAAYQGLAGATPANLAALDPQDVVEAGGDAFDLADASRDPAVRSGAVNLGAIRFVRLVDVRSGVDQDSRGGLVRDPGAGSADPDGVSVIHHQGNLDPRGPLAHVFMPQSGQFSFTVEDPDGLADLEPASFRVAVSGIEVPVAALLPALQVTRLDATGLTLQLTSTLLPAFLVRLSVSIRDRGGNRAGNARSRAIN